MLGNIFRESGVVSRISNAAQNELMNIITIFLGVTVGATATGKVFLSTQNVGDHRSWSVGFLLMAQPAAFCLAS